MAWLSPQDKQKQEDFISGMLFAAQLLVISHDQPNMAKHILKESGFSLMSLLKAQNASGYENDRMNKIIKEVFNK